VLNGSNVDLIALISLKLMAVKPKAAFQKQFDDSVLSARGIRGRLLCGQYYANKSIPLLSEISIPLSVWSNCPPIIIIRT
jgi:hypothetical protein